MSKPSKKKSLIKETPEIVEEYPDSLRAQLKTHFKGMSGWKFVSISKAGSMFGQGEHANIVPVQLHKTIPSLADTGKYMSTEDRLVTCIKLLEHHLDFVGLVMTNRGEVYMGDSLSSKQQDLPDTFMPPVPEFVTKEHHSQFSEEATDEDITAASTKYFKELSESINKTEEKFNDLSKYFKTDVEEMDPEMDDFCKMLEKVDVTDEAAMTNVLGLLKDITSTVSANAELSKEMIESSKEIEEALEKEEQEDK